jgi:microsomal dipeptidase-like Zn-dependent dipeptidase
MIADLHIHYPMHLLADPSRDETLERMVRKRGRGRLRHRLLALILDFFSRLFNYRSFWSGPRVTAQLMHEGGVRIGFSVLYAPAKEFDLDEWYAPPRADDLAAAEELRDMVEAQVRGADRQWARVVSGRSELHGALAEGKVALIHCIEGGFCLGASKDRVPEAVARLAQSGLAYITPAHLFWRGVATNANAFPFLTDRQYRWLFHEPEEGLTPYGEALVRAMVANHVMVDVSHMSERALDDTFALLDELDPAREAPVLATHAACRHGPHALEYNLSEGTVRRIAARRGLIGLISGDHIVTDGYFQRRRGKRRTGSFEESVDALCLHIEQIHEWVGSHDCTGIGTDLDGFIKPTLAGIESARDLARLREEIVRRYPDDGEKICSGNALRVLDSYWRPGT